MNVVMIFKYGKRFRFAPSFNYKIGRKQYENREKLNQIMYLNLFKHNNWNRKKYIFCVLWQDNINLQGVS